MNILNFIQTVFGNNDHEMSELLSITKDDWILMKKKELVELSQSEKHLITEKTGASEEYISASQVVSEFDQILESAKNRFHEEEFNKQVSRLEDLLNQSDLSRYFKSVIDAIHISDSAEQNKISHVFIDGLKLLRIDNFDLYKLISEKYDLYDKNNLYTTWVEFIKGVINKEFGHTLSDFRFISYIDLTQENLAQEIFNQIRIGNIQWDSKTVLDLIERGAYILCLVEEKKSKFTYNPISVKKDIMSTLLLKEYCERHINFKPKIL
jgi:hypothetical protein